MVGDDASEGDSVNVAVEEVARDAADRGKVIVEHGQAHGGHQLWKMYNIFTGSGYLNVTNIAL